MRQSVLAEGKATLGLAWPLILTNLAQIAIGTSDTVMMGWLGAGILAGGALGSNLYFAFFVFGLGLASGVAPVLAQALGSRTRSVRACRQGTAQGFWLVLLFCLFAWTVLWRADLVLGWLGQDPQLSRVAVDYVRAAQWSLAPSLWLMVLRCFLSALERPRAAMVAAWVAVPLHILANWVLMFGHWGFPPMGVVGAGISSSLSHAFMVLILVLFIMRDRRLRRFGIFAGIVEWAPARFVELARVGLPIGLATGFEVTGFNAATFLMGLIDADSVAAHAVALQVASITFMVPLGLSQAATVRVGLAAGAGDRVALRRAGWVALGLGIGFMAAMAITLGLGKAQIARWFLDPDQPDNQRAFAACVQFLMVAGLFQMADGAQVVGAGALRGLKDTSWPMLFAGLGYWGVAIPAGAGFAFLLGWQGVGVWSGLALGLGVVATLMTTRWFRLSRS